MNAMKRTLNTKKKKKKSCFPYFLYPIKEIALSLD